MALDMVQALIHFLDAFSSGKRSGLDLSNERMSFQFIHTYLQFLISALWKDENFPSIQCYPGFHSKLLNYSFSTNTSRAKQRDRQSHGGWDTVGEVDPTMMWTMRLTQSGKLKRAANSVPIIESQPPAPPWPNIDGAVPIYFPTLLSHSSLLNKLGCALPHLFEEPVQERRKVRPELGCKSLPCICHHHRRSSPYFLTSFLPCMGLINNTEVRELQACHTFPVLLKTPKRERNDMRT